MLSVQKADPATAVRRGDGTRSLYALGGRLAWARLPHPAEIHDLSRSGNLPPAFEQAEQTLRCHRQLEALTVIPCEIDIPRIFPSAAKLDTDKCDKAVVAIIPSATPVGHNIVAGQLRSK